MRRVVAATTALLFLMPVMLRGESFDMPDDASLSLNDEAFVLEIEEGDPPVATGPGFRSFGRVMLGYSSFQQSETFHEAVIDSASQITQDLGDLHRFSTRWDTISIEKLTRMQSIELMGQHMWDGSGSLLNKRPALRLGVYAAGAGIDAGMLPVAEQAPMLEIEEKPENDWRSGISYSNYVSYGVRYNNGYSDFRFDGITDVLGRVHTDTEIRNEVLGPQLTLGRVISKKQWMFDASGSLLLGYGRTGIEQINGFGDDALPGAPNSVLYSQPSHSRYTHGEEHFAAHAEVRLVTSYLVKVNWSVDLVVQAFVAGPWREANNSIVEYNAPDFGINTNGDTSYLSGANLALGVTYLR